MAGAQWKEANEYHRLALIVDEPDGYHPASQPAPNPPVDARPKNIAVTDVDRLKADPYSFYARKMLGLSRSEEHTSELQSLMRISYAVFCLQKNKNNYIEKLMNRTLSRHR